MKAPTFKLFFATTLLAVFSTAFAQYQLPPEQMPASGWSVENGIPGGLVGGIPDTSDWPIYDVTEDPFLADNTGTNPADWPIQKAINMVTWKHKKGAIIYIPEGKYKLTRQINIQGANPNGSQQPVSIVLRGAGRDKTHLIMQHKSGAEYGISLQAKSGQSSRTEAIAAGYTRGSTEITVVDDGAIDPYFKVGLWAMISFDNGVTGDLDPDIPIYMKRCLGQIVRITAIDKTNNSISFEPALNLTCDNLSSASIQTSINPAYHCGLEDFKISNPAGIGSHSIFMGAPQECWVKGVEVFNTKGWAMRIEGGAGCIFTENFTHWGYGGGGNSIYGIGLFSRCSNNYVYNNMAEHCRHSFITEYGGQGNVIAYNYSKDPINEGFLRTSFLMGDLVHHGGSPRYNLWEGNVSATIKWDNILGGNTRNTAFRNQFQRKGLESAKYGTFGMDLQEFTRYAHMIGNIIEKEADWDKSPDPEIRWTTDDGGNVEDDPAVKETAFLHGIYSETTGTTIWAEGADQTLPSSFYLKSRPAWWDGAEWPAVGPDLADPMGENPAFRRYWNSSIPKPETPYKPSDLHSKPKEQPKEAPQS